MLEWSSKTLLSLLLKLQNMVRLKSAGLEPGPHLALRGATINGLLLVPRTKLTALGQARVQHRFQSDRSQSLKLNNLDAENSRLINILSTSTEVMDTFG